MTKRRGRPPIGDEPMVRRQVTIPDSLWNRLQTFAQRNDRSSSAEMRAALRSWLKAPESPIQVAALLVESLASTLATLMEESVLKEAGPAKQLLARLCVHTVRQAQGVCILISRDDSVPAYFAEQAAQLLRGLVETWARAAWLAQAADADERRERALRIVKDGLTEIRKTIDYGVVNSVSVPSGLIAELERQEADVTAKEQAIGREVKLLPPMRQMCESAGRPDFYWIFGWESDAAHASALALAKTVSVIDGNQVHLGGPDRPDRRAKIISVARSVLEAAGTLLVKELGLDEARWLAAVELVHTESEERLILILTGAGPHA